MTRSRNTPGSAIFISRRSPTRLKAQRALGYYRALCCTLRLSTRYGTFPTVTTFARVGCAIRVESCSLEDILDGPRLAQDKRSSESRRSTRSSIASQQREPDGLPERAKGLRR